MMRAVSGVSGTRALRVLSLVGLLVGLGGCRSQSQNTRIDVTVDVDPALQLDDVVVTLSGGGRPDLQKSFPVVVAGSPPAVDPIKWEVVISDAKSPFVATVEAKGQKEHARRRHLLGGRHHLTRHAPGRDAHPQQRLQERDVHAPWRDLRGRHLRAAPDVR
jgi:hypothetical protein